MGPCSSVYNHAIHAFIKCFRAVSRRGDHVRSCRHPATLCPGASPLVFPSYLVPPSLGSCVLTVPPDSRQTTHQIPDNNMLPCRATSLGHRIRHDCRRCPCQCCLAWRQYRRKSAWNNGDHGYGTFSIDYRFFCTNLRY